MLRILFTVSLMLIGAMIDRVCWIEREKQGPCDKQPGPQAGGSHREGGSHKKKTRKVGKALGRMKEGSHLGHRGGHLKAQCGVWVTTL